MLNTLICDLSQDPFNPFLNFAVAVEYEKADQIASAVSFYLRTSEYGFESAPEETYASLLKLAKCFEEQNDRLSTVSNCLMQAVAYLPDRPEAYFLLARFYERQKNWRDAYTWARMGVMKQELPDLPVEVDFVPYGSLFEQAVSGWWLGLREESADIFKELLKQDISDLYRASIEANLALTL
jgi:tetratricopeptide (TPR) repeat protein